MTPDELVFQDELREVQMATPKNITVIDDEDVLMELERALEDGCDV